MLILTWYCDTPDEAEMISSFIFPILSRENYLCNAIVETSQSFEEAWNGTVLKYPIMVIIISSMKTLVQFCLLLKIGSWCHHRKEFKDAPNKPNKQSQASSGFIENKGIVHSQDGVSAGRPRR